MNRFTSASILELRAFTILEVMLAIAIFALAAVGFMAALGKTMEASTEMRMESEVQRELESFLAESRMKPLQPGRETLDANRRGVAYTKEIEVINLHNDQDATLVFYKLRIQADWVRNGQNEQRRAEILLNQISSYR